MAYKQGDVVESNGKKYFYNENGQNFVGEDEIKANPNKYPGFNNLLTPPTADKSGPTGTGKVAPPAKTYQDTQALAKANLDVLTPTTPLDNPIAQILLQSGEFKDQMKNLGANAANPVGMSEQNAAVNALKQGLGATDQQRMMQAKLAELMNTGRDNKYETDMYESIAGKLRREAALQQEQNQADLASRGLGMSTVVNDVNSGVQRNLMSGLTDAGYQSAVAAENLRKDYIQNALNQGIGLENNIVGQGQTAGVNLSNVGGKKADIYGNAQNAYNNAIAYQDANTAANLSLQNQAWKDKINNFKWFAELPFAVNKSGDTAASLANSTANNVYNSQVQGSANDNTNWMNLLGTGLSSFMTKGLK